jgi:DNA-binding response OmpR family regulator
MPLVLISALDSEELRRIRDAVSRSGFPCNWGEEPDLQCLPERAQRERPAAVILGLRGLHQMLGFALARLREQSPNLPVLLVGPRALTALVAPLVQSGAAAFVPWEMVEQLGATLERLVRGRAVLAAAADPATEPRSAVRLHPESLLGEVAWLARLVGGRSVNLELPRELELGWVETELHAAQGDLWAAVKAELDRPAPEDSVRVAARPTDRGVEIEVGAGEHTRRLEWPRTGQNAESSAQGAVLVVDDDDGVLEVVTRALRSVGFQPLVAHDGEEALRVFAERRREITAVITDLNMPAINGLTLIWALRRSKPDLRVLVITGFANDENCAEARRLGVRRVLTKPFGPTELLRELRAELREPVELGAGLFVGPHCELSELEV